MKYKVVGGWNRGGTSCLMAALRECGIPVVGYKYPFEFTFDYVDKETGRAIKKGIKRDMGMIDCLSKKSIRNNPSGFWEIPSICLKDGIQSQHIGFGNDGNLVKVQLDCLASSEPGLIDKVVIILRNPFKVISSAVRCKEGTPEDKMEYWKRLAALALPYNLLVSIRWCDNNNIPYKIVYYEDLLEDPDLVLTGICDFFDRGVPKYGVRVINKNLDRSDSIKERYKEFKKLKKFWRKKDFDWRHYNIKELKEEINQLKEFYVKTNR